MSAEMSKLMEERLLGVSPSTLVEDGINSLGIMSPAGANTPKVK